MAKSRAGTCKIRGKSLKLTKERFPPQAAFNSGEYKVRSIDQYKTRAMIVWQEKTKQGGNFEYVLREKCNNETGHRYGSEYVKLAYACSPYAQGKYVGEHVDITVDMHPLLVIKQVVAFICVASQFDPSREGLRKVGAPSALADPPPMTFDLTKAAAAMPALRRFILERDARGLPESVKLFMYLPAERAGRTSGIAEVGSRSTGQVALLSEFAWWPIGWVMLFDGELPEDLTEITSWAGYEYNEETTLSFRVPVHRIGAPYPIDFRNPDQIAATRRKNEAAIIE